MAALANKSIIELTDPLRWFGVLVPRELRSAQQGFKDSISITIKMAALSTELGHLAAQVGHQTRNMARIPTDVTLGLDALQLRTSSPSK